MPGDVTNTGIVGDEAADRARMLQPEIMVPPLLWLVSDAVAVRGDGLGCLAAGRAGGGEGRRADRMAVDCAGRGEQAMILIGQYDSPFVRRVAVAMRLYGIAYEHRPWSTFGDADRIAPFNPLRRVPTLVLDDGESLIESTAILDHLDERVGPGRAMIADHGEPRRHALKICALATGLADKAVSLIYERVLHQTTSEQWIARCRTQVADVLTALETARGRGTRFWFGDAIGHADIAVACALRFTREAHTDLFDEHRWPALAAHAATCEDLEAFQAVVQPFIPPS